jgi:SSS family solute:Na+ symporter
VPGYLHLRYGDGARALSAVSFAFMTVLMSGINMYSMAIVMKVVLGWNLNFSIWVSSITVALYVALGGLRSAIFNEVLQFLLIWLGALLVPILGLIEVGGWSNLRQQILTNLGRSDYVHMWSTLGHFHDNPVCSPSPCFPFILSEKRRPLPPASTAITKCCRSCSCVIAVRACSALA